MADPLVAAVTRVKADLLQTIKVSMLATMQDAYKELGFGASKGLLQAMNALAEPPSRALQTKMYTKLGEGAKKAVTDEYDLQIGDNPHARYRAGTGKNARLTGRLRPVLDGNVDGAIYKVVAGPNRAGGVRIQLFNPAALNSRAAHWARLEFGAGAGGRTGVANPVYRIGIGGGTVSIRMGGGPRPAYRIPRGFWYEGGESVNPGMPVAGSEFHLRRRSASDQGFAQTPKITQGFAGRRFLTAGLVDFAEHLPEAFNKLLVDTISSRSRLRFRFLATGE